MSALETGPDKYQLSAYLAGNENVDSNVAYFERLMSYWNLLSALCKNNNNKGDIGDA